MSEKKHTAEPWATEYRRTGNDEDMAQEIFDADGETIATLSWYRVRKDDRTTTTNREENARRIVSCVNFCKGLSTENMENDTLESSLKEVLERIKSQRDELLAALKECAWFIDNCGAQAGVTELLDKKIYPLIVEVEATI